MPQKMLTQRFVEHSSSPEAPQTDYFDLGCAGLSLRVGRSSNGKRPRRTWCLTYTNPITARRARIKLGTFPETSLVQARELAIRRRAAVDKGADPTRGIEQVETLSELIAVYQKKKLVNLRSAEDVLRRLNKNVVPFIGKAKMAKLHRLEISRTIEQVEARGSHVEATRVYQDLQGMFRWALKRGNIEANPMADMGKPEGGSEPDEGRALSSKEIAIFWSGLGDSRMDARTALVLKLALVTGQRIGEVSGLSLREIDREASL